MLDDEIAVDEGKAEIKALDCRRKELQAHLETADEAPPLLHPEMADVYRRKVTTLAQALEHPETRVEATEALRGLVDAIILTPTDGEPPSRTGEDSGFGEPRLRIELKGNLAAMLSAATNAKRSPETSDLSRQIEMVVGARNRQYRPGSPSPPVSTWWPHEWQRPSSARTTRHSTRAA